MVGLKLMPGGREGDGSVSRTMDHIEQVEVMGKNGNLGGKEKITYR